MEHRNGSRISAHVNVNLSCGGRDLGWFQCLNLGNGGMAVRGRVDGITTNSLLTVGIESPGEEIPAKIQLRALVVYRNDDATGLMWASDAAALQYLTPGAEQAAA